MKRSFFSTLLFAGSLSSCLQGPAFAGSKLKEGETQRCEASWYGPGFDGNPMKMGGIPYDSNHPTRIAHSTLPMGSMVEVTNLNNGLSVIAMVTDRGPNGIPERCVDATREIARILDFYVNEQAGDAPVEVKVISIPDS